MTGSWSAVAAATVIAWSGAVIAAVVREAGGRIMRPLVYLALLFFGLSAIFDILPQSKRALSWGVLGLAVLAGYGTFWLVGRYVAPVCPACSLRSFDHKHHHAHGTGFVALVVVLTLHTLFDGLGVSAAATVAAAFGARVFAAIAVHKLPEGFALALMLMMSGRSAVMALLWTVAIEAGTLAGALVGTIWMHPSRFWIAVVLAHIGGTFLYLCVTGFAAAFRPSPAVGAGSSAGS